MDLKEILNKTKNKKVQLKNLRTPPSIATEERPYSIEDFDRSTNGYKENENNQLENREKSGNKQESKWEQSGNKLGTNWEQTGNKISTKIVSINKTDNKVGTELGTELVTNWEQTGNKLGTKISFTSLTGLQKAIIVFIYKQCQFSRSQSTEPLSIEFIAESLNNKAGSIKTTIKRLGKKGYLIRPEFKNGRGGWSRYELPELLFREIFQLETSNKLGTNWEQTGNKVGTELGTELGTASASSSLDLCINKTNKNTTTGEEQNTKFTLTSEWEELDIDPLAHIGFTITHVKQVASQGKLTAEMLQSSIYSFAFDLEENDKAKKINGSPLNFFMGIVRKGMTYAPPENYESPQDRAFRIYFERREAAEKKKQEMENKLFEIEFKDWFDKLTNEEVKEIVPSETINAVSDKHRNALKHAFLVEPALKTYFKNNEWPELLETIKGQNG